MADRAPAELHELVAFRLPDDEDRSVEDLVALPPDELLPTLGDGTLTEPGRYVIICVIPTGVDPAVYLAASAESPRRG